MGRKPTLPIVVTNEAIKKTAEKIRGFRGFISDSVMEIALFINRQAGLLGFIKTDVFAYEKEFVISIYSMSHCTEFIINKNEKILYEHYEPGALADDLVELTLPQAIDELKKVAPYGRK